jgi:hypothetical protein
MLASAALLTAVLFVFGRPVEQGEPVTPTEVRRAAAE